MEELLQELKNAYGEDAEFRDGQKEAILEILNRKRILVVQKTGRLPAFRIHGGY